MKKYTCIKCGKVVDDWHCGKENYGPTEGIELSGVAGYGSSYDMDSAEAFLCENCLEEAIERGIVKIFPYDWKAINKKED